MTAFLGDIFSSIIDSKEEFDENEESSDTNSVNDSIESLKLSNSTKQWG